MKHLFTQGNIALIATRGISRQEYAHTFVSTRITDRHALDNASESMFVFPLYRFFQADGTFFQDKKIAFEPALNINHEFVTILQAFGHFPSAEKKGPFLFAYIYSLLSSSNYRKRYLPFLKTDFPQIPITCNTSLFRRLAAIGKDLIFYHTLESAAIFIPTNIRSIRITELLSKTRICFNDSGFHDVAPGYPKFENGIVFINPNESGFKGVPEDVWNFHIGGYQVCEKWLKDRRGRTLSDEDIEHYQKIVVALKETIRLMGEIDKVIEEHGGFPDAFVTDPKVIEAAKAKSK
jgi:predicted helicase